MRLTASLVLYQNPPSMITEAVESWLRASSGDLIVIDNSPEPVDAPVLRSERVRHVHSGGNIGFGAGHNRAFRLIFGHSDFHLILNPDVSFQPEVVPHLAAVLANHPEIAAIMPAIRFPDGAPQRLAKLLPSPADLFARRFLPNSALKRRMNARYELHDLQAESPIEVPSLSGCFLMVRTAHLAATGGFDERYFMYMEDVDLVRRLGDLGQTIYDPRVAIMHGYGKGSYRSAALLRHHLRSAVLYFNKWGWARDPVRTHRNARLLSRLQTG